MQGFFKKWKEGIKNLTPLQQLRAKIIGTIGGTVGLILALVTLIMQRLWGFAIFIFFIIFIQGVSLISLLQQYDNLKQTFDELEPQDILGNQED